MPRNPLSALLVATALLLSACGGGAAPPPTVDPMTRATSTPRPTVTLAPEPTEEPTPTRGPEPTEEPTPTREPKPIDDPTETTDIALVTIDGLEEYSHPDGLFTISVPTGWEPTDSSEAGYTAVTWTDAANNALVGVVVTEAEPGLSQDELATRLQSVVDVSKDEPDFSADDPTMLDSGGVQIIYSYTAEGDGGITAKLLVNSFIYQDDNKLSVLLLGVPDEQFDGLKSWLDDILNSYVIDPSVGISGVATTVDDNLPGGELYDFSDTKGGWIEDDSDTIRAERVDGLFSITLKVPNNYYVSNPDMEIGTEQGIAATVEPMGDARAGVFVRLTRVEGKSTYYACWIDAQSQYGCFVSIDDEWTTLQDATEDATIIAGAPNRVRMTAYGDTITFSVNGQELATLQDDQIAEGRAGLYLENFEDEVGATYDDVVIASE
jgi:hypothetical protein